MIFPGTISRTLILFALLASALFGQEDGRGAQPLSGEPSFTVSRDEEGMWTVEALCRPCAEIMSVLAAKAGFKVKFVTDLAADLARIPLTIKMQTKNVFEIFDTLCGAVGLGCKVENSRMILYPFQESEGGSPREKELEKARDLYRRALVRFSDSPRMDEAYFHLGKIALLDKDYRTAAEDFSLVWGQYPQSKWEGEALFLSGKCFFHLEEWRRARTLMLAFLNTHEGDALAPNAYTYVVESLVKEKRTEEAIRYMKVLIKSFPQWRYAVEGRVRKAEIHLLGADAEKTKEVVVECREYELSTVQKQRLLKVEIEVFRIEEDRRASKEALAKLLQLSPSPQEASRAYLELAKLFTDSGQNLRAIFCLQTLLHDFTDQVEATEILIDMGNCYLNIGLKDYALDAFQKAKGRISGKDKNRVPALARGLFLAGQEKEASHVLEDALGENPDSGILFLKLARCYFDMERTERCLAFIRESSITIQNSPQWPDLRLLAGDCFFLLGRIGEAEDAYRGFLSGGQK